MKKQTRYILNSGGIKNHPERKRQFHREIVKGSGTRPRILICSFAQPREYWEKKFPGYQQAIAEDMPADVHPSFELAMPITFAEQCLRADIIYFNGGDDHLIQYWMRQFDIQALFTGKTIATNSASSDMLAQSFYTCDWRHCMNGLGILPLKFIPHYLSTQADDSRGPIDWQKVYEELAEYGDQSLPIYTPQEGEFIIIEH